MILEEGFLSETDGVLTLKNKNTTSVLSFNNKGEVEYIFVNPFLKKI